MKMIISLEKIMPVNEKQVTGPKLYQRELYAAGGITKWYWDYKDQRIIQSIPVKTTSILDLGCGEGILLEKLAANFPQAGIRGVDFLSENVEICRKAGLNVTQGDLYKLVIPDNSIETVLFIEVVEHLADPELALSEIFRILKPGGSAIILFPNDFIFAVTRLLLLKIKELKYDPGHLHQWTPRQLKMLLMENGFIVQRSFSIPFLIFPISLHGLIVAQKPWNHLST
jgi:2-polyprenyl-3-methyl-5-hydroxy-6-metoxy-1,4-benzoquinol methylase